MLTWLRTTQLMAKVTFFFAFIQCLTLNLTHSSRLMYKTASRSTTVSDTHFLKQNKTITSYFTLFCDYVKRLVFFPSAHESFTSLHVHSSEPSMKLSQCRCSCTMTDLIFLSLFLRHLLIRCCVFSFSLVYPKITQWSNKLF